MSDDVGTETEEPRPGHLGMWLVDELHLTVGYEIPRSTSLVRDWWAVATGLHPRAVTEEPLTGAVQVEGEIGEANLKAGLIVRMELSRLTVVWQYGARPSPDLYPAFDDVRQPFVEFATRWLGFATAPPIQRLGFGGSLLKLFPRIEDCRLDLDGLLQAVDMKAAAPLDFRYQGNRPCPAQTMEGLMLNRIAKWRDRMRPPAIQLDLDINTFSNHVGPLDRLPDLFKELVGHADQFAKEGDRL